MVGEGPMEDLADPGDAGFQARIRAAPTCATMAGSYKTRRPLRL